jgi:hypothetical protein
VTAQVVNVLIALIAIYISLALAASFIQEQIAAFLKLRSQTLWTGITQLLSNDADAIEKLRGHPLIAASSDPKATNVPRSMPSYIDARNFTMAFWQTVGTLSTKTGAVAGAVSDAKAAMSSLTQNVNDWIAEGEQDQLRRSAAALVTAAQGDYEKLLNTTDAWFNAQMDRASGWYKRQAQYVLIAIGVVVAFAAGIDSIDLGRQLFAAPQLSAATADAVSQVVKANATSSPDVAIQNVSSATANAELLQNLRLSRWYSPAIPSPASSARAPASPPVPQDKLPVALFGMLITAVAIALGAPFWFDLLKGVVNVRMAGIKPSTEPPAQAAPRVGQ